MIRRKSSIGHTAKINNVKYSSLLNSRVFAKTLDSSALIRSVRVTVRLSVSTECEKRMPTYTVKCIYSSKITCYTEEKIDVLLTSVLLFFLNSLLMIYDIFILFIEFFYYSFI